MDVSNVDPEEVLVDFETACEGDGDVSIEVDEAWAADHGKEDKVMVSIRSVLLSTQMFSPCLTTNIRPEFAQLMDPQHGFPTPQGTA